MTLFEICHSIGWLYVEVSPCHWCPLPILEKTIPHRKRSGKSEIYSSVDLSRKLAFTLSLKRIAHQKLNFFWGLFSPSGDADSDGDGVKVSEDADDDNDGLLDVEDADDDGDGVEDEDEDNDGDGISNEGKLYEFTTK